MSLRYRPAIDTRRGSVASRERFDRLDALRGVAIVWMAVFHFCYDLNYFGLIHQNFRVDPVWTLQRAAASSRCSSSAPGSAKRWPSSRGRAGGASGGAGRRSPACAVLVSAGSAWMFPRSWISFGILHGIAVMLILARLLAPLKAGWWLVGLLAIALPQWVQHPFFDTRWTTGVGLVTHKAGDRDYAPCCPGWACCCGAGGGPLVAGAAPRLAGRRAGAGPAPPGHAGPLEPELYMLHQPVLIGTLWLVLMLRR